MSYPYGGINAVSLGTAAGSTLQGSAAIAIGYFAGAISQPASSIVINATGSTLSGSSPNALYVAPIRNLTAGNMVLYDTVNQEVVYSTLFNGTLTANNLVSLSSLTTSSLATSSIVTTNLVTSSLVTSTLTANIENASTINVSSLQVNNASFASTVTYSTMIGSTIVSANQYYSTLTGSSLITTTANISSAQISTLQVSSLQSNTVQASIIGSQFINYSTLTGSTINGNTVTITSTLTVSSLFASTLTVPGFSLSQFSTLIGSSLTASTLTASTISLNTGFVASTFTVSTLIAANINVSSLTLNQFSTLTGSSLIASTIAISTITANTGFFNSTLTVSTLYASSIVVPSLVLNQFSTLTGSSLIASTVAISTITANTGFFNSTLTVSTLNASSINVPGLALNAFSTLTGSSLTASTLFISTITTSTLNVQFLNYSTLVGSTISSTQTYTNLLLFSSISSVNGSSFGNTGPTGPIGQASQISYLAPGTQVLAPSTSMGVVTLTTLDPTQTSGSTGFTFNPVTSLFTNSTTVPIPISANYFLSLNTTSGGYSAVGLTVSGTTTYFGGMYNDSNGVSNAVQILVPAAATVGLYYMDNATTTILNGTRFTLVVNQAGQQGPTGTTGPTGPVGQVSQVSYTAYTTGTVQTIVPTGTLQTLVVWPATSQDSTQTIGTTGLLYNYGSNPTGTFTNVTSSILPIDVQYTLNLSNTSGGYSAVGINGSTNIFGGAYNDSNGVSNSCVILVPPGSYFGVYYMDNASTQILQTSRISCTLLTAGGVGPTGMTGPVGPSAIASYLLSTNQTVAPGSYQAIQFSVQDTTQSQGIINFGTSTPGVFINNTGGSLSLLVEYTLNMATTSGGYSGVGINGNTTTLFGGTFNDSNGVSNSCVVIVPAGQTIAVYYSDNTSTTILSANSISRVTFTILTSGSQGATGVTGPAVQSAMLSYKLAGIQNVPAATAAVVNWATIDSTQTLNSSPITGPSAGAFTNSSSSILPVLIEYTIQQDVTGNGSTYIQLSNAGAGSGVFGSMLYTSNIYKNSFVITMVPGSTISVYVYDNATINLQTTYSRITLTVLQSGPIGPTGLTGPVQWAVTASTGPYGPTSLTYAQGFVGIGPIGAPFLQNNVNGNTGGTGSTVAQYPLDVVGIVRAAGYAFADSSVMTTASPPLDYTTFGLNWSPVTVAPNVSTAAGCAMNANGEFQTIVFAGTYGIYYSVNYGLSWTAASLLGGTITSITFLYVSVSGCGQFQVAAATNGTGLYVSNTMGVTWRAVTIPGVTSFSSVAVSSSGQYMIATPASGYIRYSTNYGITWTQATSFTAAYTGSCMSISGQYQYAYSNGNSAIYYSSNYGQSWSLVTSAYNPIAMCCTASGQTLYMMSGISIYYSSNYGQTWFQSTGAPIQSWNTITCTSSGQYVVMSGGSTVYYSSNYGNTWAIGQTNAAIASIAVSSTGQYLLGVNNATIIQSVTKNPGFYTNLPSILGGNVGMGLGPTGSSFLQTTTGGATAGTGSAAPQYQLDVVGTVRTAALEFMDNSAMVSATAVLDYTTFGINWTSISSYLPATMAATFGCGVSASGQYQTVLGYVGTTLVVYVSSNYGQTWSTTTGIPTILSTLPSVPALSASGQYQIICGSTATTNVYISSNYGVSWSTISSALFANNVYNVCISASGQYMSGVINGGIIYSTTYGATWLLSNITSGIYTAIASSASGQYQVAGFSLSSATIVYSSNYGQTWTNSNISVVAGNNNAVAISASGQYVTVVSGAGIYYSSNYGATFVLSTGSSTAMVAVAMTSSGQYQVAVGNYAAASYVYYSSNYGITWTQGTATTGWTSVAMSSNGQYLLATVYTGTTGGIYQSVTRQPPIFTGPQQGLYLTPNVTNASSILQYFQMVVNTVTPDTGVSPWWCGYGWSTTGTTPSGSGVFFGGVLHPNGNVVLVPWNGNNIGIYNPNTNTFTTGVAANGYQGGVLLPNGSVLFVPNGATRIGIYNAITNTFTTPVAATGYDGGVLLPNGNVLLVPYAATSIGIFNPTTNGFTTVAAVAGYIGGVLLPNGNVVLIPSYITTNIGLFNSSTNTFTTGANTPSVNYSYIGGVLLTNGNVLFVPNGAANIGIYNPTTNIFTTGAAATGYQGGVLLPNGNVLLVPTTATSVGIYNPITNALTTGIGATGYNCGVLLPNGNVVLVPYNATTIGIVTTGLTPPRDFCLSPYYNKL